MTEIEYAVRLEDGDMVVRPSREEAETTVRSIRARGGTAVLLSRTVVRSDWAEATGPADLPRSCDCGKAPDPGICPRDCAPWHPAGGHCACVHAEAGQ